MADCREKVLAEVESIERVLAELPDCELSALSVLELVGVAGLLHNFYNGVENIFKQLILDAGLSMPDGSSWHRDLLSISVDNHFISKALMESLKQYLAFRHFFSHAYALELNPGRLEGLVDDMPAVFSRVLSDIDLYFQRDC
jgi:uncharacterized protein YutE (UPF0331/DUF86 family)